MSNPGMRDTGAQLGATARERFIAPLRAMANYRPLLDLRLLWWKHRLLSVKCDTRASGEVPSRQTRRVLVYCPEGLVRQHVLALQVIARILAHAGSDVLLSYCRADFMRCVSKDPLRGDAPRAAGQRLCISCMGANSKVFSASGLNTFDLRDAITPEVKRLSRQMVRAVPDTALTALTIDGAKIGEACRHDLLIGRKLMLDTPLEREQYLFLRQYIESAVASYLGMKEFLPRAGITDVLLYGQYAANVAVICAAERIGVNWRLIANADHLGVDRRRTYIHRGQTHLWLSRLIAEWPEWRETTLAADEIEETGSDILVRFGATSYSTYSPPKTRDCDVFSTLGLDPKRRVIVAFTSSLDEYHAEDIIDDVLGFPFSGPPLRPYRDQIEWLTSISGEIAARDDLQLVIRVHPREDANKREGVRSRHLEVLRRHLASLPQHVTVVWPGDPVSSYDLLEVADVVQAWSSTIGLESARVGIPVVKIYRGYVSYPEGDFALSGGTHAEIIAAMNQALRWQPSLDRLIKAWRYYAYSRLAASMDLRDVLPTAHFSELPPYRQPKRMNQIVRAVFDDIPPWTINRQSEDFLRKRLREEDEKTAVRRELRRIIHAIFTGENTAPEAYLPRKDATAGAPAIFTIAGPVCTYHYAGTSFTRYSPLCARLATMVAEHTELDRTPLSAASAA